jgi:hypothetical protein
MFSFKHRTLIVISGLIWLSVGVFLLQLGLKLLKGLLDPGAAFSPVFHSLSRYLGGYENAVVGLIALGLLVGFFKGRLILAKSVNRLVNRVRSFEEPTPITKIYNLPYYLLLVSMMFIGFAIKYFEVPSDIRGAIDVAIGAALINGAMLYFRQASTIYDTENP